MHTQYNVVTLAYRNVMNDFVQVRIEVDECCIKEIYLTG